MAQTVDFYVVSSSSGHALERVACRIAEKAWQQGHRVYLRTASADAAAAVDDLLWTFKQNSFVPHARVGSEDGECPVLIGERDELPPGTGVLINLAPEIPAAAEHCERVADLVADDDASRAAGRARYRHYRDLGVELRSHEVSA